MMVEARPVLASDDGVRAVYAAHGPELYRFALRSLGDRGLAEEAVQETFVRAWQAANRFDDALGSLRTWLFAIVRNVVIDLSRARAVRPALVAETRANEPIVLDDDVDRVLVAWQVEEALQKLSDEHRDALVEVHYKARPYHEVARDLGVPVGTVKSRVVLRAEGDAARTRRVGLVRRCLIPCRDQRAALGAVALGGADPAEALALRAHLDGCADCRTELRELMSVAAALPLANPSHVTSGLVQPPAALAKRVLGRVTAERAVRRTRTRRRVATVAATAVAIAAAIITLVLVVPGNSPAGTRVVLSSSSSGVSAAATLRPRAAGTEVAFHVSGLHPGSYYWLWITGVDDRRVAAGTFEGTEAPTNLVMTAAVPLADARRIWVTDAHDRVVLDQRLPAPA